MKQSYVLASSLIALTLAFGLCLNGCAKRPAETTEEFAAPSPTTVEQPPAEQPSEPTTATGVGDKLGKLLGSVHPPSSYEMKIIPPAGRDAQTVTTIMKMAGRKPLKMKVVHDEGWAITDLEAKVMYIYSNDQDMVMKMPLGQGEEGNVPDSNENVDLEATIAGSGNVDGVDCWLISTQVTGHSTKVWVGKKDGLPRKVEAPEGVTKVEYSRINQIPDSEFALPAGVKVMEMPQMPSPGG